MKIIYSMMFTILLILSIPMFLVGLVAGYTWMALHAGFNAAWEAVDFILDRARG